VGEQKRASERFDVNVSLPAAGTPIAGQRHAGRIHQRVLANLGPYGTLEAALNAWPKLIAKLEKRLVHAEHEADTLRARIVAEKETSNGSRLPSSAKRNDLLRAYPARHLQSTFAGLSAPGAVAP